MTTILDRYVAIAGLGWADKKHDVWLLDGPSATVSLKPMKVSSLDSRSRQPVFIGIRKRC